MKYQKSALMGKDDGFKRICNIEGYKKVSDGKKVANFYSPDIVFEKESKEKSTSTILIAESSSAGDRKVHIGEIAQFIAYVSERIDNTCVDEFIFMLFLAGIKTDKTKSPPTVKNEKNRVLFYFNVLASDEVKAKVKGIYVIRQDDDKLGTLTVEELEEWKIWPDNIENLPIV